MKVTMCFLVTFATDRNYQDEVWYDVVLMDTSTLKRWWQHVTDVWNHQVGPDPGVQAAL